MGVQFPCSYFVNDRAMRKNAGISCLHDRMTMFPCITCFLLVALYNFACSVSAEACEKKSEFKPNTAILPHQSVDAGAKFIDALSVNSMHECYFACCQAASSCTRAVYKSKSPRRCFLFDCGSQDVCVYGQRANYDLIAMLDQKDHQIVAKLGQECNRHRVCSSDHSVCSDGQCTCQSGWIRKESLCVPSVCKSPDLQFQCNDSSTCVAIYDRCNGIVECPDASDEANCPTEAPTAANSTKTFPHFNGKEDANRTEELHHKPHRHGTANAHWSSHYSNIRHNKPDLDEMSDTFALSPFEHPPASRFADETPESSFITARQAHYSTSRKRPSPRHGLGDSPGLPLYWDLDRDNRRLPVGVLRPTYTDYLTDPSDEPELYSERERSNTWESNPHPLVHTAHERPSKSYQIDDAFPEMDSENDRRRLSPFHERIVDPSVFRDVHEPMSARKVARHRRPVTADSKSTTQEVAAGPNEAVSIDKSKGQTDPVPEPSKTTSHTDVFSVLQQNQSQSHTAALILAFSLGLICCLIVLMIIEWRRRLGRRTWAMRRRPASISVPFGGRAKSTGAGHGRPQTSRSRHAVASDDDEDGKPLYDGMVL